MIRRPDPEVARNKPTEDQESILKEYFAWFDDLSQRGILVGRRALELEGAVLRIADGKVVDGPFVETKEVVMGFVVLAAPDFHSARAIARTCPALRYGDTLEVRRVSVVRPAE